MFYYVVYIIFWKILIGWEIYVTNCHIDWVVDYWTLSIMNTEKCKPININHQNGNLSSIDLSICSPIIDGYLEWDTADDVYRSDYFPIIIWILNNIFIAQRRPRWKLSMANWENYENDLNLNEKHICKQNRTQHNSTNFKCCIKQYPQILPNNQWTQNCPMVEPRN